MVAVTPTTKNPTHHMSLSDGTTTIGLRLCDGRGNLVETLSKSGFPRTAMRMSTGAIGYGDYEPPYTPIPQTDFGGGRGVEDADADMSRYFDCYRVDTTGGDILMGPHATYTTGLYSETPLSDGGSNYGVDQRAGTSVHVYASPYTTGAAQMYVDRVKVPLAFVDTAGYPNIRIRAHLYSDNAGSPGSLLAVSGYLNIVNTSNVLNATAYLDFSWLLAANTPYWFGVEVTGPAYYSLSRNSVVASGHALRYSINGGAWQSGTNQSLYIQLRTRGSGESRFFEYRGQLYAVTSAKGGVVRMYMNGHRGVATSNGSGLSRTNTTLNLSGVNLAGKVIKIIKGPGSGEEQNWRTILSNTTTGSNDSITVDPPWAIFQDTTTEFVILGCDTWQDVRTMPGGIDYSTYLYNVTDVCVSDDVVHFAQGYGLGYPAADSYIIDFCQDNDSGTFRSRMRKNGTNRAKFLMRIISDSNKGQIWRATINPTSESFNDVARAPTVKYGSDLVFGTSINCGSEDEAITGILPYGNPVLPYVLKEGSFGSIKNDVYAEVPISEMQNVRSDVNGRAHLHHGVYLYFSLLDGIERYYDQSLDDMGPNRNEGMPQQRKGPVRHMIGYPGRFYYCIDGGSNGYSCVMCYNGTGHHEIYRSPVGKRISRLHVQVIPGDTIDRLWVAEDEDMVWLPVALNPRKATGFRFAYSVNTELITGWYYGNLKDVQKYWHSVTLFTEGLVAGDWGANIRVAYQVDDEDDTDTWHFLGTSFTTSPVQEIALSPTNNVVGRRIRLKIVMLNLIGTAHMMRVKALVLNTVVRMPAKFTWTFNFLAEDYSKTLGGVTTDQADAKTLLDQMDRWADSSQRAAPLLVRSILNESDSFYAFIEPSSVRLHKVQGANRRAVYIGQAVLIGM